MNNDSSRLRHTQKQESTSEQRQEKKSQGKEFSTVEELLRHDAAETVVPSGIAVKLNQSIANAPKPETKSWWQRFLSRE